MANRAERGTGDVDSVRWGVLSTADIAMGKVVPAMQAARNGRVVAIASRGSERARDAARKLGIDAAYGSYEALLASPDVDAVYLPLPNDLHAEWAILAAQSGKHVLCEKPLAMDATQALRMVEAFDAAGLLLQEAFMYRHHPSWEAVMALVADGSIGELQGIQTWFSYANDDPGNIRNQPEHGGGAVMDIGCYPINLSRMVFGAEPVDVTGRVRVDPVMGVDTVASVVMEFPGGGQSSFTVCIRCEAYQRVHLVGTQGRIEVEIPFNIPPDRETTVLLTAGGNPPVAPATRTLTFPIADQYTIQAERFAAAVLAGGPPPVPPTDAVANLRVLEAVLALGG